MSIVSAAEPSTSKPWPLMAHVDAEPLKRERGRLEASADEVMREADEHRARVASELRDPELRDSLLYMFEKLAVFFLQMIDIDLRSSHLKPAQPAANVIG